MRRPSGVSSVAPIFSASAAASFLSFAISSLYLTFKAWSVVSMRSRSRHCA